MGRRRRRLGQPRSGSGQILVQSIVAGLLEGAGIDVDAFLRDVREGRLSDGDGSRFDEALTAAAHPALPETSGDIVWRTRPRTHTLELKHVILHSRDGLEIHFWSSIGKGLSQIRFDGVELPETTLGALVGMPLSSVTDHPLLQDPGILIRSSSMYRRPAEGPRSLPDRPSMLQFAIEVPTTPHPDHPMPATEENRHAALHR